jgi:surface protein
MLINEIKEIKAKNNFSQNEKINELMEANKEKDKKIEKLEKDLNEIKMQINELDKNKRDIYKNELNLIYETEDEGNYDILGKKFIENNKEKIELNVNGIKIDSVNIYKLQKGKNNIKLKIKNRLTNMENMFYKCSKLKNIDDLKYLNTKYCTNFKGMFYGCTSLSDIWPLEKWNVSKGNNFKDMFYYCSSLSDIKPLEKWNVSNANNFSGMFGRCSLKDTKPLKEWNVQNFQSMFYDNIELNNIKYLKDVVSDSFIYFTLDNTFSVFKSIEDILFLIYSNKEKSIITYNIFDNKLIKEIKDAHNKYITNIRHYFDSIKNRDLIMSISMDNNIKIWNFKDWNLLTDIKEIYDKGDLDSACFLNDNNQIYILTSNETPNKKGESGPIKIYDLEGNKIKELYDYNFTTYFIDIYYDNNLSKNFIITGNLGFVMSYDYNEMKRYHKYIDIEGNNTACHCSIIINSKETIIKLIESSYDGNIRIWNFHSGLMLKKINVNIGKLYSISLLNDNYLIVGCGDKTIKIIDLEKGIISKSLTEHNKAVIGAKAFNYSYTSYFLSQGNSKDQIKLWKIE